MRKKHKLYLLNLLLLLSIFKSNGQIQNYIYSINNASPNLFFFSKIEISTGIITNFQQSPIASVSTSSSSCIDNQSQIYYFCTGTDLMALDPTTGQISSTITLPLAPQSDFKNIAFNPCDSSIYGIVVDITNTASFSKYNPVSGLMTPISSLAIYTGFIGGMSFIDPITGIYTYEDTYISGVSLSTGQVVYHSPIIDLPGENFGHIALKCSTHEIFGTSADVIAGIKYLSTINPNTGVVTHVSNPGWSSGFWKPINGGARIDQLTGTFYYSGAGGIIIGANTLTGNLVTNLPVTSGELLYVEHFSDCNCTNTSVAQVTHPGLDVGLEPTLFTNQLHVKSNETESLRIILYDITSKKVMQSDFINSVSLNTECLAKGIYIYEVCNKNGYSIKGKVIKQ
jgi:hypothetical protein